MKTIEQKELLPKVLSQAEFVQMVADTIILNGISDLYKGVSVIKGIEWKRDAQTAISNLTQTEDRQKSAPPAAKPGKISGDEIKKRKNLHRRVAK